LLTKLVIFGQILFAPTPTNSFCLLQIWVTQWARDHKIIRFEIWRLRLSFWLCVLSKKDYSFISRPLAYEWGKSQAHWTKQPRWPASSMKICIDILFESFFHWCMIALLSVCFCRKWLFCILHNFLVTTAKEEKLRPQNARKCFLDYYHILNRQECMCSGSIQKGPDLHICIDLQTCIVILVCNCIVYTHVIDLSLVIFHILEVNIIF